MSSPIRAKIEAANDIRKKLVKVDDKFLKAVSDEAGNVDNEKLFFGIIIASAYDPQTGQKIFSDSDIELLESKSSKAVDKLATAALEINGLGGVGLEAAKKV